MDITRNWRLKLSRRELLATRNPATGTVMVAQQTPSAIQPQQAVYVFEPVRDRTEQDDVEFAHAAR